jgi:ubiquinone/menaquinone biosynthesis C-methylase UbiE
MGSNFDKYQEQNDIHWQEAFSRSIFKFNAYLRARYQLALGSLGNLKGKIVLDIGAGDCALASLVAQTAAKVIAIDNSSEGLEFGKSHFKQLGLKAEFLLADAYKIPLADKIADAVVSADLIEHLDRPEDHIKEVDRLLKPGGRFVITTPYRLSEIPAPYHVREFYPSELKNLLEKHFIDIQIKESHHVFWYSLYTCREPVFHQPLAKYLINMMSLWFNKNPFLKDDSSRKKRDYFTQIICSCRKNKL